MIPRRIALSGFLSYRDEQEIKLEGSELWMLSGPNGSGKSSIFDAITFSLFGYHRGGSQQVGELINKDSNAMAVEFDFTIDRQTYRIRRTIKRTSKGSPSSTQQIYQRDAANALAPTWIPIADTNRRTEFDIWIRESIGLSYETFTSSVLLLQGQAEKLLNAKPRDRAEILANIVDLERYQKLHEKADIQRKELKDNVELLEAQIDALPKVTDEQIRETIERIQNAEAERARTGKEVERLQRLEFDVRKWEDLRTRITQLRQQWEKAHTLLGNAVKIEAEYQRFVELKEVLPHINTIQQLRADIEGSESRSKKLEADRQQILSRRFERSNALDLARKKRTSLQDQQTKDEQRRQQIETRLRELTAVLERLRLFEEEQTRLADLENQLQRLPANPRQVIAELQSAVDRCQELVNVLPSLERFDSSRTELAQFRERLNKARQQEKDVRRQGEDARKLHEKTKSAFEAAVKARTMADARATEARTLLDQRKTDLKDFQKVDGKRCRYCGQTLTAAHIREEKAKRQQELKEAEATEQDALRAQTEAKTEESRCESIVNEGEKSLQMMREKFSESRHQIDQATRDVERSNNDCRKAYESLPASYLTLIAPAIPEDWSTTKYPQPNDFATLRRDAGLFDSHRHKLREAEEALRLFERLQNQADTSRQAISRLRKELPAGDPASIRGEHATVQAEETALKNRLSGSKKALADNQNDIDRLIKEISQIEKQLSDVETSLRTEEVHRKSGDDSIERSLRLIPGEWQAFAQSAGMAEQHQWKVELLELDKKNAAESYQQLSLARVGVDGLKRDIADTESQLETIPEEARVPVVEAEHRLQEAKQTQAGMEKLLRGAEQAKAILDHNRSQREKLSAELLEQEREFNYATLLAQLLGRDRLQRHLVRVAERQIVDYANAVLDRLSGGQLRLRLSGSDEGASADRALELEAFNRITGDAPINVAFLSGSQRFRAAVSLALGMGQYASRQHRPIESVIIDEGFGCLDREGRQVMIQELHNLRGQLRCILLVSHQEEIADAFPDGYHFELKDGATRVTPFRR